MTYDRQTVRTTILDVIDELTDLDPSTIADDADLFDLGVDSLEFTTVLVEVEERLGDDIPADAFDRFADLELFTLDTVLDALAGPARPPGLRVP